MARRGLVVDLFAGGGGASTGIEAALGRPVDLAINHSPVALEVHRANHPETKHYPTDIWDVDPFLATRGRPVDVLWASPDCTHHSRAKGGKPRSQGIRSLAHVVTHWARAVHPRFIFVENVGEFAEWGPLCEAGMPIKERRGETFERWCGELRLLGYSVDHRVLDASQHGAPTKRRRLFIVARRDGLPVRWPEPTHGPGLLPLRSAAECIDWSLPCPSIFERKRPLAEKTLWRVAQGIRRYVLENPDPFTVRHDEAPTLIQTGYGERAGQRPRHLDVTEPLGTVVAGGQKHALVSAFLAKHYGDPLRKSGGGVVLGSELPDPVGTITAKDHHSLAAVTLAKSAGGIHVAQVRGFLTAYYGSDGTGGQSLDEPVRTIRARHCLGLVTVQGVDYQITDIGLRMLEPHELLRAQFGEFGDGYDMSAAATKAAKVRLIGNSVPPHLARAVVAANIPTAKEAAA